jgi:hypothetical protein
MLTDASRQPNVDEEHLRVLSVLYFVYGGLAAGLSLVALVYLAVGMAIGAGAAVESMSPQEAAAAVVLGGSCAALASAFVVLLGLTAAIRLVAGFALRRRRHYTFCLVVAGITSFEIPIGALLGIATLIVLLRPSVEKLFHGR